MKRVLTVSMVLFAAVFLLPLLTAGQTPLFVASDEPSSLPEPSVPGQSAAPVEVLVSPSAMPEEATGARLPEADALMTVLVNGVPQTMALRDFLYGAVAAEMPALYPEQALKAQAVAIRTLVLYAQEHPYHEDALICSNWEHCLAYAPLTERAADWGDQYEEFAGIIRAAVDDTEGMVILYEGEPIEAVFFAVSDGQTRSAAEVWGAEVSYLQGVESAFDRDAPNGARGHGVGMSQYGARQLAVAGLGYADILRWYYTGVEVVERNFS